jgi:Raf kinase inhibitor-like YbhB/YbcL family protein
MLISSPVFENDGEIPRKYTCDGEYINPPLLFSKIPVSAKSLTLVVEDPDAPVGLWVHWMIWNLSPQISVIKENAKPGGNVGKNSSGNNSWDDICPPDGEHRYFFKLFALDIIIDLDPTSATRDSLIKAMEGHIIEKSELMGKYNRMLKK